MMSAPGTSRTSQDVRLKSAKWGKADLDQVVITTCNFMNTALVTAVCAVARVPTRCGNHPEPAPAYSLTCGKPSYFVASAIVFSVPPYRIAQGLASMRDDRRAAEPPSGTSAAMADRPPSATADRPPCRCSARLPAVSAGKIAECIRKPKPATPRRGRNTGRTSSCLASARPAKRR